MASPTHGKPPQISVCLATFHPIWKLTHAFVIGRLQSQGLEEIITEDLKTKRNINTTNITQLRTKGDSLYMVITSSDIKMKDLTKISDINHTKVY